MKSDYTHNKPQFCRPNSVAFVDAMAGFNLLVVVVVLFVASMSP